MPAISDTVPFAPRRILIPVDGSPSVDTAIAATLALASAPRSITLLHVIDRHGVAGEAAIEMLDTLADDLRARLATTAVETLIADGDPTTEILNVANELQPDLIVMATREFLAPTLPASRTISTQVARIAERPVLVVRANAAGWRPQRVMVPLDGSIRSLQALPIAAGLATDLKVPVHLVAVIDPAASLPAAYAWSCPNCDPDLQDALTYLQCQANDLLNQAERSVQAAGVTVTSELLLGTTVPALIEAIQPGDVVVMTTRGAGNHDGTHAGSVATRMLRESPVPVVVLHPHLEPAVTRNTFAAEWVNPALT